MQNTETPELRYADGDRVLVQLDGRQLLARVAGDVELRHGATVDVLLDGAPSPVRLSRDVVSVALAEDYAATLAGKL